MENLSKIFSAALLATTLFSCSSQCPNDIEVSYDEILATTPDPFEAMEKALYIAKARPFDHIFINFSERDYYLPKSPSRGAFINLDSLSNVFINGNGARIELDPYNAFITASDTKNLSVSDFKITHHRPSFTQGKIVKIDVSGGFFLMQVDDAYPKPPSDKWAAEISKENPWRWGVVYDSPAKMHQFDFPNRLNIESVKPENEKGLYKVKLKNTDLEHLKNIAPDMRFVLPLPLEANELLHKFMARRCRYPHYEDAGGMGVSDLERACVSVSGSENVTFTNLSISRARTAAIMAMANTGDLIFRKCSFRYQIFDDLISTCGSGMLFISNKSGPVIEECIFEGQLNDAINLSAVPSAIVENPSELEYKVGAENLRADVNTGVYYPDTGKWVEGTRIVKIENRTISTDRALANVQMAKNPPVGKSTQIYNLDEVNAGFSIRKCYFDNIRMNAIAIYSREGVVEDNLIVSVGGCGVRISNEADAYFCGPLPKNIRVLRNSFLEAWGPAVFIGAEALAYKPVEADFNIEISGNRFVYGTYSPKAFIEIDNGCNIDISSNDCGDMDTSKSAFLDVSRRASKIRVDSLNYEHPQK